MKTPPTPPPPDIIERVLPGEARVAEAARSALTGRSRGMRAVLPFLGPAFVAAVAYVNPGNFATNVSAGSQYGYMLLWVILASNLMAMLIQTMSAKLGIATGMNLPEVCRAEYSKPVSRTLWVQAEVIAMATDLAEFLGAALGFYLLFGIPLFWAGVLTGVFSFAILALQSRGARPLEIVITMLVGVILIGFAIQFFLSDPSPAGIGKGLVIPGFEGTESVLLATGILGATVMPHVIYLHSALTQRRVVGRSEEERKRIFRFERIDVIIAMTIAGMINMSMLIMAAGIFHTRGLTSVEDIDEVFYRLGDLVGANAQYAFGAALLASGLSSSSVGTLAGQVVMQGFIDRQIPLFIRRGLTMAPALVVLAIGVNPSRALVLSQVVLSFGIPFALIPLLSFCRRRDLMGGLVNHRATTVVATAVVGLIVALNGFLVVKTLGL